MTPRFRLAVSVAALILAIPAHAERSSANYQIASESFSPGAGVASSANYEIRSSLEPIGGSGSSANYRAESGWTGFEYQVIGLTLDVTPTVIEEGETAQLFVTATLDDLTTTVLNPDELEWSIEFEGFVTYGKPIQRAGILEPLAVEGDSVVTLVAQYGDLTARTELTVLDDETDGLDFLAWQRQHFPDPQAPEAQPEADPDGDLRDNHAEFLGGFDPNDPADFLSLRIVKLSGGEAVLEINKVIPDRIYTLRAGTDLTDFPETVSSFTVRAEERDRTEVDSNASTTRKFYRLIIEK